MRCSTSAGSIKAISFDARSAPPCSRYYKLKLDETTGKWAFDDRVNKGETPDPEKRTGS